MARLLQAEHFSSPYPRTSFYKTESTNLEVYSNRVF